MPTRVTGDPEMIRIAKVFADEMLAAVNQQFQQSEIRIEAQHIAIRFLTMLLLDRGAIDQPTLQTNAEAWIETIRGRQDGTEHFRKGVELVFSSILGLDGKDLPPTDDNVRKFGVIEGGRDD